MIQSNGLWIGWPGVQLEDPNTPIPESDPSDCSPTAGLRSDQVCGFGVNGKTDCNVKPYVYQR